MKLNLLLATVVLLASGCSRETEPAADTPSRAMEAPATGAAAPAPTSAPYTIVMLGDSLTAGFGLAPDDALPERLEDLLKGSLPGIRVINAGVSGDTSAGGLARFEWSVSSADPDLLVLQLGANDYLGAIGPARTRANLAEIIERAQSAGIDVLLVSVEARSSGADDPRGRAFAAIYPELADTYSVPLHDGLLRAIRDRPELLLSDGLHPTAEGVETIAQPLSQSISAMLPDATDADAP